MMKSDRLAIGLLAILMAGVLGTALPMANEDELVSLDSVEQVPKSQHILKIAPKQQPYVEVDSNQTRPYDTIVEQLKDAGVETSKQQPLNTLSYKELTRLLALLHMSQGRNYYEASENRARFEDEAARSEQNP